MNPHHQKNHPTDPVHIDPPKAPLRGETDRRDFHADGMMALALLADGMLTRLSHIAVLSRKLRSPNGYASKVLDDLETSDYAGRLDGGGWRITDKGAGVLADHIESEETQ